MNRLQIITLLKGHVPEKAFPYCLRLWEDHPFQFTVTKKRLTKVGDFTAQANKPARITVNNELHPLLFLVTYVHEVAHWLVYQKYANRVEAHGNEWKLKFQQLMEPVMNDTIFPPRILRGLRQHMINPKASTYSDAALTNLFRSIDPKEQDVVLLSQIEEGSIFGLNGRWFKKGKVRRTRVLCKEVKTQKNYLVPVDIPINSAQLSFF